MIIARPGALREAAIMPRIRSPSKPRPRNPALEAREPPLKYVLGERRVECRGEHYIAPNATVIGSVVLESEVSV